jgi:hypothetical protein
MCVCVCIVKMQICRSIDVALCVCAHGVVDVLHESTALASMMTASHMRERDSKIVTSTLDMKVKVCVMVVTAAPTNQDRAHGSHPQITPTDQALGEALPTKETIPESAGVDPTAHRPLQLQCHPS